jgi:hypothetical protein
MNSQRITTHTLEWLATAALMAALLSPCNAFAEQFLSITLASEHFGLDGDYNEFNPGLGYWRYADESALAYGGGCFRNSEENLSCYGGVGASTDESRTAHVIGYAGLVSGYDKIDDCSASICPLIGGAVRTRLGPGLVSFDLLPGRDGDDTGAILALQYLVRLN